MSIELMDAVVDATPTAKRPAAHGAELMLTNARIVTPTGVFSGSVVVHNGHIAAIDDGPTQHPAAIDCNGDYLLPGLLEMHTDNLEKHLMPRPGVLWPSGLAAALAHDSQVAAAGITTVYDAVCIGEYDANQRRRRMLELTVEATRNAQQHGLYRADHQLHLRCEISDPEAADQLAERIDDPLVRLVSLMDHTPGQRQWVDTAQYRLYKSKEHNWTDAEFADHLAQLEDNQQRYAERNRAAIIELCRPRGLPLASHDDTTAAHVDEAHAAGIRIAEFPTSPAAARRAREHGMTTVLGAPNVVRGGSHSGNVSALELARGGLLDSLSSDYVPASLLHAVFVLHEQAGLDLPAAVDRASGNIARTLGLHDRGSIDIGKRADLIRVHRQASVPAVTAVWRTGTRVI